MYSTLTRIALAIILAAAVVTSGCDNQRDSLTGETAMFRPLDAPNPDAPAGLVTRALGNDPFTFWPYT